jgi:hypothetical protein
MTTHPENLHTTTPSGKLDLGGLGIGLMQWGTTEIDNRIVNPKGNLTEEGVRDIWKSCREHHIVFFDTAEGKARKGGLEQTVEYYPRWWVCLLI